MPECKELWRARVTAVTSLGPPAPESSPWAAHLHRDSAYIALRPSDEDKSMRAISKGVSGQRFAGFRLPGP
eukprot:10296464-Alexandrium_andersonii.AAC.1